MRLIRVLARIATLLVAITTPLVATALPFTVTDTHPRIYLDPARVNVIQTAAAKSIPLNGTSFPRRGLLQFDFNPATGATNNDGVFDAYSSSRNHLFLRHYTPGSTPPSGTAVGFQIAYQPANDTYISSCNFWVEPDQWHSLEISWDPDTFSNSVVVDGGAPICTNWRTVNGSPVAWEPDGQKFIFAGKGRVDNIRLYNAPDAQSGTLLAEYDFDMDSGFKITDLSGAGLDMRINESVQRVADATSGFAIEMDGDSSEMRVIAPDPLTEAWQDTLGTAAGMASTLATNPTSFNVTTSAPYGMIEVARSIALAWLVTNDTTYLDASRNYGELLACVDPTAGNDRAQAGRVEAMGVIYDWTFNASDTLTVQCSGGTVTPLKTALSDAIRENILAREQNVCGKNRTLDDDGSGNLSCNVWPPNVNYISGHPHENNTYITAGLLAVIDERPDLEGALLAEYENFVNGFNPARAWIAVDGGHHMGFLAYGALYGFLDSILLFETATTDVNMVDTWQGQMFYRFIYGLRGDLKYPASGDATKNPGTGPISRHAIAFSLWAANYYSNTVARGFYDDWQLPFLGGARFNELFLLEENQPADPISMLPLARHFSNSGQVFARDTWDIRDATLLSFKSTSFWTENHHHLDQNAFTLFYKEPLITESGFYDTYGSDQWHNYFTRSIAHNTLTVRDPAEVFYKKKDAMGDPIPLSNDGGQQFLRPLNPNTVDALQPGGTHHLDGVVAYENQVDYVYMAGNASKAYAAAKLDQNDGYTRSILYLRDPSFWSKPISIIYDKVRVQPGQETLEKRILFHTINEPLEPGQVARGPGVHVATGDTFEIRNGDGMAYLQSILPANRTVNLIGGVDGADDYRFYVRDENSVYQDHPLVSQPGSNYTDLGEWRLEFIANDANQTEHFLNVISVTDNVPTAPSPPTVQNLTNSELAASLVGVNQVIAFNKMDVPVTSVDLELPVDDPAVLLAGVKPSTPFRAHVIASTGSLPYRLLIEEDSLGSYTSSSQGVLSIDTPIPVGQDLSLSVAANTSPVHAGELITYVLTITHNGPTQATGVTLSDTLPGDVTFDSVTTTSGSCTDGPSVTCTIGTMNSGETVTVTITAFANVSATITNTALLGADQADPIPDNNVYLATTTHLTAGDIAPRGTPDGSVNAADLLLMQQLVLDFLVPTPDELTAGDVHPLGTGDGQLSIGDLLLLHRAINGELTLPPPNVGP